MGIPEFKVVPNEIRESIQPLQRNRYTDNNNPLIEALKGGQTVFIETTPRKLQGLYQVAQRRNFKMVLRQGLDGDKKGSYVWWTPITQES